ncbi:hypothetical protein F5Y18DRAFT_441124 [Xylariaceae sp. FL1019]|nr:hypothetical protein F5Y18DRAFT_441124 [Xylariaceae sp. FL1019]
MPQSGESDKTKRSSGRRRKLKAIFSPWRSHTLDLPTSQDDQRYEDLPSPEQRHFEASTLSAWSSIRENCSEIEKAASRLAALTIQPEPEPERVTALAPLKEATTLERLPEEILIHIMKYLDHESLYLLTRTKGHFLRISFDGVFESDASWRTFRHTVSYAYSLQLELGYCLRTSHALHGISWGCRASKGKEREGMKASGTRDQIEYDPSSSKATASHQPHESAKEPEKEEEGQTMLEFMSNPT